MPLSNAPETAPAPDIPDAPEAAIPAEIQALVPEMRAWRRALHAHPELGFEEEVTSDMVARVLTDSGVEVHRGLGGTGVIGTITGRWPGNRVLGLRAELDALPIQEATGLPYASTQTGRMHACGHDGHMAMLLGAAKALARSRDFAGRVHVIFQPAEENLGGGRAMVEEGLFARFPMDGIYGLHNWPGQPFGTFALRPGAVMAATARLEITLSGPGGHAAMPHLGGDQILAAAHLVTALQAIPARFLDPVEGAVVSITQIQGGEAWNALPSEVVLRGTVRALSTPVMDHIEARIRDLARGVVGGFGAQARVAFRRDYPPTINHAAETAVVARVAAGLVGADNVDTACLPTMGAEDFSFMLDQCPGAYVRLGAGGLGMAGDGGVCGLHNPGFDFNDALLPYGAAFWVGLVADQLGRGEAATAGPA